MDDMKINNNNIENINSFNNRIFGNILKTYGVANLEENILLFLDIFDDIKSEDMQSEVEAQRELLTDIWLVVKMIQIGESDLDLWDVAKKINVTFAELAECFQYYDDGIKKGLIEEGAILLE